MKRILGMLVSIAAMAFLLGGLTGCPDKNTKTTDTKKVETVKKDSETTKKTEETKVEKTEKK